ncbi:MAG: membrane protein insertase YidC [Pyrinomonadaceae bacterium]
MEQKRLLIAFVLSAAILFGWTFYMDRNRPRPDNSNATQASATTTPTPALSASASPTASATPQSTITSLSTQDTTPHRVVTIKSLLYEVQLDSRGAVATSWIIDKNKDTNRPLFSVAGDKNNRQKLQLIPSDQNLPENLRQDARTTPLRLVTGDANLDALISARNYQVNDVDGAGGDVNIKLQPGEQKTVTMTLRDEATGVEVVKSFSFDADNYIVALSPKLTRGGQAVPSIKLAIGPSIGDQGVPHYTGYSTPPQGIADVDDSPQQFYGYKVYDNKEHPKQQIVNGTVDWAGVGDTYFAMLAVPSKKAQGLQFVAEKYEHPTGSAKEDRYLVTGLLDIPADGTPTVIYVGPKDHDLLTDASKSITQTVGRSIHIERAIDYGRWLGWITRYLAVPILSAIKVLNQWTGSYGVAIIIFTFLIYSLFFPLKWRSTKAMKKAQKHAPRMKELQEKMKSLKQNDPRLRELQVEQLKLMKEANPLGGCLPLLIQMPFLIALYTAITISIDFRQATFLWLPDLSAADPYRLLPILMAASMVVLQFITPQPSTDPMQRKMMAVMLPAFMLYIMWSAPAGLLVYWLMANLVGFGQQMLINRMLKSEDDEGPEPPGKKKKGALSPRSPLDQRKAAAA